MSRYISYTIDGDRVSAYDRFPGQYKFASVLIAVADISVDNRRVTYDFIGLISNIGGSQKILMFVVGAIVSSFGVTNRTAHFANRFYTWDLPKTFESNDGTSCRKRMYAGKINYQTAT